MKCSELWLKEWVQPALDREQLCQTLTMAGLEVEEVMSAAPDFTRVVVAQISQLEKHPDADRLHICQVITENNGQVLQIVCGAKNVAVGAKVALAQIAATLPHDLVINESSFRNVLSQGMLCSAKELGLAEESEGILILPVDAPLGEDLRNYLKLNDYIIDLSITPNRGDCLSIRGVAREISALTQTALHEPEIKVIPPSIKTSLPISVKAPAACPRYVGRIIKGVKADAPTPLWLKERLRRSGIRSITAIVDVTNYVMLELGQPMHAFDLDTIEGSIIVRESQVGEEIALLDGSQKILNADTLIIADKKKPLAIAGVMGGLDSSVTLLTKDIFLESAYFSPEIVAKQRQHYALHSESSYRFERGVDPAMQRQAIERASQLILTIAGGEAGPVEEIVSEKDLPPPRSIKISSSKIAETLGLEIPSTEISAIFTRLGFSFQQEANQWIVVVPTYRFDLSLPEDLIEEIARVYGYDNIPTQNLYAALSVSDISTQGDYSLRQALKHRAYHEVISYSFIDEQGQALLDPMTKPYALLNPMTSDMAVMRTNLWPGLVNTLIYNKSRQQHRVRLFEIGMCFVSQEGKLMQQPRLAGLLSGSAMPEQWGETFRQVDFYDLKGDLQDFFLSIGINDCIFKDDEHAALHPGQTAAIYIGDQKAGVMGALHPHAEQAMGLSDKVFLFELDLNILKKPIKRLHTEISRYPEIRRDIAILVNQAVPVKEIQDTIRVTAGDWLKDVFIFDVYNGKGISPGLKSIALALIFQHPTRTLVDDEVTACVAHVTAALNKQLGAALRS